MDFNMPQPSICFQPHQQHFPLAPLLYRSSCPIAVIQKYDKETEMAKRSSKEHLSGLGRWIRLGEAFIMGVERPTFPLGFSSSCHLFLIISGKLGG
jgi:hypothetical protein